MDVEVEKRVAQDQGNDMPVIEAPREIIEHLNMGKMKEFEKDQYCIYKGVFVCEVGKKQLVEQKLATTHRFDPDQCRARLA